ncbi:MAG: hypothetical protein R6W96_03720 [Clostridia bacterium]
MRICIVYALKTGNTESLAREAKNMLASLDNEATIFPVEEYDLMLVGSCGDPGQGKMEGMQGADERPSKPAGFGAVPGIHPWGYPGVPEG